MPRFVLLYHDCPSGVPRPSHYDLMLESGGVLRTWVLTELPRDWAALASRLSLAGVESPSIAAGNSVAAERLGDHRLAYLEYEGPVSGGRGSVSRLDGGTTDSIDETPDRWEVTLAGNEINGRISLRRQPGDDAMWQLTAGDQ